MFSRLDSRFLIPAVAIGVAVVSGGMVVNVSAQGTGVQSLANSELNRRQVGVQQATQMISEGDAARQKGELDVAVRSYRAAIDMIPLAPATQGLRDQAVARFAETSVDYARERAGGGHFEEAEGLVDTVLLPTFDPTFKPAVDLKIQLQDPEVFNRAATPAHYANVAKVNELLIQAEGLFELGKYGEASETFAKVLTIDPFNVAATRGMEMTSRQVSGYLKSASDHTRSKLLAEVDASWETQPRYEADVSSLFGDSEVAFSDPSQSVVGTKLKEIIFPRVEFTDASLQEVVTFLGARSKTLDNTGDSQPGVNIILDERSGGGSTDISSRRVSLSLSNVPLGDVLKFVTDLTGTRTRLEPYAVEIVDGTIGSAEDVRTRSFRVPPNFLALAESDTGAGDDPFATGDPNPAGLEFARVNAKDFLSKSGVTFGDGATAQFIASTSTLIVRNTETNLDLVAQMVTDSFARSAQQVKIDVIMLETTQRHLQELGFDWLVGGFNVPGSDRVFGSGGTLGNSVQSTEGITGDFPVVPPGSDVPVGQYPLTAGNRSGNQINELTNSIDSVLVNSSQGVAGAKAPGAFTVAGVFSDPQFQVVIRTLNQSTGADISMSPSIVARSGQRASMKVIREFIYPIEFDPPEIPQSVGTGSTQVGILLGGTTGFGTSSGAFPVTPATPTAFETREVGTLMEVEPVIAPDGKTISLNIVPEFNEFEGFVDYGEPIRGNNGEIVTENRIVQPIFRTIRESVTVDVYDGETVAIGGLSTQRRVDVNDKVPLLGDVPGVGRLFRSEVSSVYTQAIVFLVRATIIDPGGRRVAVGATGGVPQ